MKSFPISIKRDSYRGSNPGKRQKAQDYNRVVKKVEQYINDDLAKQPNDTIKRYDSSSLAGSIGEFGDVVKKVVCSIDGSGTGVVTIVKGDFERAMTKMHSE